MSKREKFEKLLHAFANANYECGNHLQYSAKDYYKLWNHANKCEVKLWQFLEPYLPKD